MSQVLVTGCPRSGTGYASRWYSAQGLRLGHECDGVNGQVNWMFAVDASYYPPYCRPQLRPRYDVVVHQVRDPVKVIGSLEVLDGGDWRWVREHCAFGGRDLAERVGFWLHWTDICDSVAQYTYRVEDIESNWPLLCRLLGRGCRQIQPGAKAVETDYNTRPHGTVTWAAILDTPLGTRVADKARRYGYDVPA